MTWATINIRVSHDGKDVITRSIVADVCGYFALHRSTMGMKGEVHQYSDTWTITYIRSGMYVKSPIEGRDIAEAHLKMWEKAYSSYMPASEAFEYLGLRAANLAPDRAEWLATEVFHFCDYLDKAYHEMCKIWHYEPRFFPAPVPLDGFSDEVGF